MPQTPHVETHFTSSARIRDIVIGMSDGLTVPFALAAGLSGVVDSTGLVITAGLAEVAAGAIAMGLGGYLAARTDAEHYDSEYAREEGETSMSPRSRSRRQRVSSARTGCRRRRSRAWPKPSGAIVAAGSSS
jgi:VIT1/CCC1 family predicted Fe2+/Mn2+ transporter